jgi:hypothetical protein
MIVQKYLRILIVIAPILKITPVRNIRNAQNVELYIALETLRKPIPNTFVTKNIVLFVKFITILLGTAIYNSIKLGKINPIV